MRFFILATLLVSGTAFAGTKYVAHDYHEALGEIAYSNACITEDMVRTIRPARVCATALKERVIPGHGDSNLGYSEWYCPRFEKRSLERSRTFERTVCTDLRQVGHGDSANLECFAHGKKTEFLPAVIKLQVWEERGDTSTWPGKTVRFAFPSCT